MSKSVSFSQVNDYVSHLKLAAQEAADGQGRVDPSKIGGQDGQLIGNLLGDKAAPTLEETFVALDGIADEYKAVDRQIGIDGDLGQSAKRLVGLGGIRDGKLDAAEQMQFLKNIGIVEGLDFFQRVLDFADNGGSAVVALQSAAIAAGRTSPSGKTMKAYGVELAPIAKPIQKPGGLDKVVATVIGDLFANRGVFGSDKIEDYRSDAAVAAAVAKPKVAEGSPLGPLTIYRPGLGNTAPGPAQIARLAQYTDKLVIAFANPGKGAEQKLRPVTEVDGVALPPELLGKVFAIGSPDNIAISWEQASDLFVDQLETLRRAGIDLEETPATIWAHSQGGMDATKTRSRFEAAGKGGLFRDVFAMASPMRGSPVADEVIAGIATEAGAAMLGSQAMAAVNALDPDYVPTSLNESEQKHLDFSLVGHMESGEAGQADLRMPFKITDKAIEMVKLPAALISGDADLKENDGLVTVASQKFGRAIATLPKSYDHAGVAEDPAVVDFGIEQLLARQKTQG